MVDQAYVTGIKQVAGENDSFYQKTQQATQYINKSSQIKDRIQVEKCIIKQEKKREKRK